MQPAQEQLDDTTVAIASLWIADGLHGRKIDYALDEQKIKAYRVYHSAPWRLVLSAACITHMLLALFEKPTSLVDDADLVTAEKLCLLAELLIVAVYATDILLYARFCPLPQLHTHKWLMYRLALVVLFVADGAIFFASGYSAFRFSRFLRPTMLIARGRNLRRMMLGAFWAVVGCW